MMISPGKYINFIFQQADTSSFFRRFIHTLENNTQKTFREEEEEEEEEEEREREIRSRVVVVSVVFMVVLVEEWHVLWSFVERCFFKIQNRVVKR